MKQPSIKKTLQAVARGPADPTGFEAQRTSAKIELKYWGTSQGCNAWATAVIGQDPMGNLDVPVQIQVGGLVTRGTVTGYVASGSDPDRCEATITIAVKS
jgi:hypothetical protein